MNLAHFDHISKWFRVVFYACSNIRWFIRPQWTQKIPNTAIIDVFCKIFTWHNFGKRIKTYLTFIWLVVLAFISETCMNCGVRGNNGIWNTCLVNVISFWICLGESESLRANTHTKSLADLVSQPLTLLFGVMVCARYFGRNCHFSLDFMNGFYEHRE